MKRIQAWISILLACLLLVGCAPQEKPQYDEATNQRIVFHGIGFQIPKAWEKAVVLGSYSAYITPPKSRESQKQLAITFAGIDLKQVSDMYSRDLKGKSYITRYKKSSAIIAGKAAFRIDTAQKIGSKWTESVYLIVQAKGGILIFAFTCSTKAGLEDFEKVIGSMKR